MDHDNEISEIQFYLQNTPRYQWPDFLINCKLMGKPPGEDDPKNWREGFEADMYWCLPSDVLEKLRGYVKKTL